MASNVPEKIKEHKRNVKKLNKVKTKRQWWLDYYEGAVTNCRHELQKSSISVSSKVTLNEKVLGYERGITFCKTQISSIELKTAVENAAISSKKEIKAACSNVESRDLFKKAKKNGLVNSKSVRSVMLGFAGTGKSHILAFLLGEEPPSMRISTALLQTPVRAVGFTRMAMDVLVEMGMDKKLFKRISDNHYSIMVMKSAKDGVTRLGHRGVALKMKGNLRKLVHTPAEPADELEEDLIVKFHQLGDDSESLEDQIVVEMSDCGGQPQFLEILPRFIENISLGILVIDLSQSLDDYPLNYYYNEDGESVGEGVKSLLTNEQVLRLCLRMIASQCQGGRRVRFVFVGTHRDLEGNCTQSREEKNRRLKEMVESFGLEDFVIYRNSKFDEFIFAVDAKHPEDVDRETISDLRELMMDESAAKITSIPVSYHGLELALKKKVKESSQIAFHESEILKEVSHFYFTEESLKDALRYLHEIKLIFYFEKEFPGVVIGEPQCILNKHTEVVAYHIELTTNPNKQEAVQGIWKKFSECGILNVDCLKKFPSHYVDGVFSPADMMKLFEKLLIVSEVSDGEYLMPCVLRADPQARYNQESETQSVPPIVLHFPGGPARYGVFCGIICHVMTESKWKLFKNADSMESCHLTRNSVHFSVPGYLGKVTINDLFDSFFLVSIHGPRDVPAYLESLSILCMEVRDTLIHAINDVTEKLNYSPDTPKVAFLCEKHMPNSLHPAEISKLGTELLCTKDSTMGSEVTANHRVWLASSASTSSNSCESSPLITVLPPSPHPSDEYALCPKSPSYPSSNTNSLCGGHEAVSLSLKTLTLLKWKDEQGQEQAFRLVDKVSAEWMQFGMLLDIGMNQLKEWGDEHRGKASNCWKEVMEHWLERDGTQDYPATWEGLYTLLKDVSYSKVAADLRKAVHIE